MIILAIFLIGKDIFSLINKKNTMYDSTKFIVLEDTYYKIQFIINIVTDILITGLCLIDIFIYKMDSLIYILCSLVVLISIFLLKHISLSQKIIKEK